MNLMNEGVLPPNELDDRDERREESEVRMADTQKTTADIIAEMRRIKYNGEECSVKWCLTEWADRLDAAHRRDTKELRVEIERLKEERNYSGVRERERLRAKGFAIVPKEQLERGDCAKLREALKQVNELNDLWFDTFTLPDGATSIHDEIEDVISTALSAPPRNCDIVPIEAPEAADVFHRERPLHGYDYETHDWLLAPATEKEGGAK